MQHSQIELGMRVRDPITGYQGIAVGRATWVTGCDRIAIRGEVDEDGPRTSRPDLVYVDEPALEIVDSDPAVKARFQNLGFIEDHVNDQEEVEAGGPGRTIPK